VRWTGEIPVVPPLEVWSLLLQPDGSRERWLVPNPNAPLIDGPGGGVGNAVVFLRGVDPAEARPWDHDPVRIELRDRQIRVFQGAAEGRTGFVQRGSRVEMISRDPCFHSLHAAGAAFFTLAFPDPHDACVRSLDDPGVVELSSASGLFAMRAYLFVDDHPYYTRTGPRGTFVLPQVPAGRYEVVCWLPSWVEAGRERDPETNLVSRLFFRPPLERVQVVTVAPGTDAEIDWEISADDFSRS
jgi:hypothetical protein